MSARNVRLARQLANYPVPNVAAKRLSAPAPPGLGAAKERLRRAVERLQVWAVESSISLAPEDWAEVDAEVDAAFEAGDAPRAMKAVKAWERHARKLKEAVE